MDTAELIKRTGMTRIGLSEKQSEVQEDFIWIIGPETMYQMAMAEYKTEYQYWSEFFGTKQTESETQEKFWRRLIETEREYNFEGKTDGNNFSQNS